MSKKLIFVLSLLFMISFSTGVFAQIISTEQVSFSTESLSFWRVLSSGIKNDLITILVTMLLSVSVYLAPCLLAYMICKVFALGFSAAYLLAMEPHGFPILCAVLFPSCLIRLPAYAGLVLASFLMTKRRKNRSGLSYKAFVLCAAALLFASLSEAVLFQLVGSP